MRLGLFGPADEQLVLPDQGVSSGHIPIQSQGPLVFGDALCGAVGKAEDHAQGEVRESVIGSQGQSPSRRGLCCGEPRGFIVRRQAYCEIGLDLRHASYRVDVGGVEDQGAFEKGARLGQVFKRDPFTDPSLALKIEVQGVGRRSTLRPSRLGRDQLGVERVGDARHDLVLHLEEIGHRPFEPLSPKMTAALRVNELRIYAHSLAAPLHASLKRIAHVQLAPDLRDVESLAPISERGVPRDDE